ncbi:MAG TPA: hypothetical protein VJA18_05710 [Candidatus Nanoarchaeia archaeon]|nr:hypothetical protein [Candidatus Nanoarchaeia archaeon]
MKRDLERIDRQLKRFSRRSTKAPSDFLENELRRLTNWYAVFSRLRDFEATTPFFANCVETLEREYQCYFERAKFRRRLKPSSFWKFTYAGCNGQIEGFLEEQGLDVALQKLYRWPKTIEKKELSNPLRRYFMGIGYLHQLDDDTLTVHPNFLFAQLGTQTTFRTADSSFLSRDLIRCPYHEAQYDREEKLSDTELWNYWKDLLALSVGRLPQYIYYSPEHLRGKDSSELVKNRLRIGRRFVPSRYVELEPKIDRFEWYFPRLLESSPSLRRRR